MKGVARCVVWAFCRCEAGNTTLFGAMILAVTGLVGGLAADAGNAWIHRKQLQAAADSAALGAVMHLPDLDKARAVAMDLVAQNLPSHRSRPVIRPEDIEFGIFDQQTRRFAPVPPGHEDDVNALRLVIQRTDAVGGRVPTYLMSLAGIDGWRIVQGATALRRSDLSDCGGSDLLGELTEYLFVFTESSARAAWNGPSDSYIGEVALAGSDDRSSRLKQQFETAVAAIQALQPTPGYEDVDLSSLDGLDTRDGVNMTYVMNITRWDGRQVINIAGDAGDTFIFRWDSDPSTPHPEGEVRFHSGGGINPLGDLSPTNFVHLAGQINASGGGQVPSGLRRYIEDLPDTTSGGGYLTGYWLTLGDSVRARNPALSRARIVGGWFTAAAHFSITSSSAGIRVAPPSEGLLASCASPHSGPLAQARSEN